MPHMDITHSRNLGEEIDMPAFCERIAKAMEETGMFPLGGIRVRAIPCESYRIADGDPANSFADLELRVGAGRTVEAKRAAGEHVWAAAVEFCGALFGAPHFALSMEMREIDPDLSWKKNSIHARLATG